MGLEPISNFSRSCGSLYNYTEFGGASCQDEFQVLDLLHCWLVERSDWNAGCTLALEQQHCNPGAGIFDNPVHGTGLAASQMEKLCDCCKRYADHLDEKMKCFRRHMGADFRHGMIIPKKFIDNFGGMISRTIELESSNGNMYVFEVSKRMGNTVLHRGWQAFIDEHHIEENDSLLFRHIEKSRFEILVLDSDDCEKVFFCPGINIVSNVEERGADSVNISNSSRDYATRSSGSKRLCTGEDTENENTDAIYSSSEDSEEGTEDIPSEHESSFELDDGHTPSRQDYVLARGRTLSRVQDEKVTTLIQDVGAEIPVFVAVMKPSNVKSQTSALVIPKGYAVEHFPPKSQTVTLQRPGKSKKWHPRFHIRKDKHGSILCGPGWFDFVRDTRVQVGDICIFERMMKKGTGRTFSSLRVHLLRKSMLHSGGSGTGPKRVSLTHGKTRVNSATPKGARTTDGRTRAKATSTASVRKEPGDEMFPGGNAPSSVHSHGHEARQGPVESNKSRGPRKRPYIISSTACLTREQEMNVDKRARSLQSDVPIYASVMNKSSVGDNSLYAVTICRKYAAEYLPAGAQTVTLLRAEKSKTWEVKVNPRIGNAKMLKGGWREFAHDNHLKLKDICLFQLMTDQRKLTMMVDIIRHNEKR
uniref:B3 domain-containing protein n=1 Tax=Aegilops tauschii TaxID=37682 RepID=M8AZ83_AEGTA